MAEIGNIKAMKTHLKNDDLLNIYLFHGSEDYLKDLYTSRIKDRIGVEEINCYSFGENVDIGEIKSICSEVSMFGDVKMIVISNSKFFKSAMEMDFIDVIVDSDTYVVFKENEIDKRTKIYKEVLKKGIVFECKAQTAAEVSKMIMSVVKSSNRIISNYVVNYLISGIGTDINTALNEIEKVILFTPEGTEITKEIIDNVCCLHISAGIFDINDALLNGNNEKAYRILKRLLENKESPIKIIAVVGSMWSQIYNVKMLSCDNVPNAEIMRQLNLREFVVDKYKKLAKNMSLEYIKDKIILCEELDKSIKSGLIKENMAVELLAIC